MTLEEEFSKSEQDLKITWRDYRMSKPECGRRVLIGNHRNIECIRFDPDHRLIFTGQMCFIPITSWCYIEMPEIDESIKERWNKPYEPIQT